MFKGLNVGNGEYVVEVTNLLCGMIHCSFVNRMRGPYSTLDVSYCLSSYIRLQQ